MQGEEGVSAWDCASRRPGAGQRRHPLAVPGPTRGPWPHPWPVAPPVARGPTRGQRAELLVRRQPCAPGRLAQRPRLEHLALPFQLDCAPLLRRGAARGLGEAAAVSAAPSRPTWDAALCQCRQVQSAGLGRPAPSWRVGATARPTHLRSARQAGRQRCYKRGAGGVVCHAIGSSQASGGHLLRRPARGGAGRGGAA